MELKNHKAHARKSTSRKCKSTPGTRVPSLCSRDNLPTLTVPDRKLRPKRSPVVKVTHMLVSGRYPRQGSFIHNPYEARGGTEAWVGKPSTEKLILQHAFSIFFFFFGGTGAWTQGLHLEPLHQPYFCERFFEIGSCKLFALAGFKLRSSWSLPPA
jgi:hypothetical protein